MYVEHFGLRQRPFRTAPDAAAYYPAATHEEALHRLHQALADDEGAALLTGEPGSGKTLLATVLLDRLGDQASCVFLPHVRLTGRADLLQAVLYDLGLPYEGRGEQELRLALTECLLQRLADGQRTILLIDEAHHLPPDVLEELRLLGNLETRQGKAVQVLLFALPDIEETLRRAELRALRQRLTARTTLNRLPFEEAADYLRHHLRVAGARPDAIVTDEAVELIAKAAGGLPRLLNQAAHLALSLTCAAGQGRVDAEGALEALSQLGLGEEPAADEEAAPPAAAVEGEPGGAYLLQQAGQPPRLMYRPGLSG